MPQVVFFWRTQLVHLSERAPATLHYTGNAINVFGRFLPALPVGASSETDPALLPFIGNTHAASGRLVPTLTVGASFGRGPGTDN